MTSLSQIEALLERLSIGSQLKKELRFQGMKLQSAKLETGPDFKEANVKCSEPEERSFKRAWEAN